MKLGYQILLTSSLSESLFAVSQSITFFISGLTEFCNFLILLSL